ncbi:MAG TPA: TraB/GumN family protein [Methylophilaceae bacterium]|nr:TraB/GumN family protein [Methylophilaceae bacterium]
MIDCPPQAAAPTAEQARAAMRNARDHGFLWRVSKDGRTSYLYGTMHAARMEWMFPGPRVSQALQASAVMALELDMLDPEVQRRMTEGMAVLKGAPLPEALARRMEKLMRAECIPPEQAGGMIPEMQLATLSIVAGRRDGIDPAYAIDLVLAGHGHAAGMRVVSLETPEGQLGMLQMETSQDTIALVERDLEEIENGRARVMLNRVASVWSDSDGATMQRYSEWCECMDSEVDRKLMKRLLDDRNPALAQRIDALHGEGKSVFAAVGSLHMFGPQGIPALLSKRGYRVERVDFGR